MYYNNPTQWKEIMKLSNKDLQKLLPDKLPVETGGDSITRKEFDLELTQDLMLFFDVVVTWDIIALPGESNDGGYTKHDPGEYKEIIYIENIKIHFDGEEIQTDENIDFLKEYIPKIVWV